MKKNSINSGLGISTLLMIFTVLCLTIFATLSYLQANYNYNQTMKIVESTQNYYDADYKAVCLYRELQDKIDTNMITESWLQENEIEENGNSYTYSVQISDTLKLSIELEVNDSKLTIITWKEVSIIDGNYDYQPFVD